MKKIICLLIFPIFMFNSCGKIECPAFDSNLNGWLPYNQNDQIVYFNQNNDTLRFVVSVKNISESYEIKRCSKCGCDAYAEISCTRIGNDNDYIYWIINQSENITYTINVNNDHDILGLSSYNINDVAIDTIINSKTYKVIAIEGDTINNNYNFWKLIHAKDVGIIKMYNRKTKDEWTLVE